MTGSTRPNSSSTVRRGARGRVDCPPMSIMSAPSLTISRAAATAASTLRGAHTHTHKGNIVDVKGNLVDVKGNLVDVKGNLMDVKGRHVDVKGNIVDYARFVDLGAGTLSVGGGLTRERV
eukprot:9463811-Pyramimonas_sp.AAC.1